MKDNWPRDGSEVTFLKLRKNQGAAAQAAAHNLLGTFLNFRGLHMGDLPLSTLFHPNLDNAILPANVIVLQRAFGVGRRRQYSGIAVNSHLFVRYFDGGILDVPTLPQLDGFGL